MALLKDDTFGIDHESGPTVLVESEPPPIPEVDLKDYQPNRESMASIFGESVMSEVMPDDEGVEEGQDM